MLIKNYKLKYYQVIEKMKTLLINYYCDRICSIVVFGSVGRDKFHPESDIDILIILTDAPKGRFNRFKEFYDNVYLMIEEYIKTFNKSGLNIQVSPIIKTKDEAEYGRPLFIEMADECKVIFDKNNYFNNLLDKVRAKLREYKSEKIPFKGSYYWKLKPDYKWGEEIEI